MTGRPQIKVEDAERSREWPGEKQIVTVPDAVIGKLTMGAELDPGAHLGGELGPEEAGLDAMEGLVATEVTTEGVGVEDGEDILTK